MNLQLYKKMFQDAVYHYIRPIVDSALIIVV